MSMTRLADALGVKRPTLLYHFPTRADIIVEALRDLLTEQAGLVMPRIDEHDHPIDRLFARVRAVHDFHEGSEERIVFLSQAIAAVGRERMVAILEVGEAVFAAHRKDQAERIRAGIRDGLVQPCDVEALMALIRSFTEGMLVQRVMTDVDFEPVHEFLWSHVLAPLKKQDIAA